MPEEAGHDVACPYCGSAETELISLFGQLLLTVQYYCRACHTPFDRIKGDDIMSDAETHMPGPEARA
jgi:DNA-directed RNA polymerase subunit RPC12/RpoP